MLRYRIAWRSLLTNFYGHGDYINVSHADLTNLINDLNHKYANTLTHWIEIDSEDIIG